LLTAGAKGVAIGRTEEGKLYGFRSNSGRYCECKSEKSKVQIFEGEALKFLKNLLTE
jgi:hypothetical protein